MAEDWKGEHFIRAPRRPPPELPAPRRGPPIRAPDPTSSNHAKRPVCKVCGTLLYRDNTTGLCRVHNHTPGLCRCRSCQIHHEPIEADR